MKNPKNAAKAATSKKAEATTAKTTVAPKAEVTPAKKKVAKTTTEKVVMAVSKTDNNKLDRKTATITLTRDVKYNYPKELLGQTPERTQARKAWRQKVRKELDKLAAEVTNASTPLAKTQATKKYEARKNEVLSA
jgi:hypothetical protein